MIKKIRFIILILFAIFCLFRSIPYIQSQVVNPILEFYDSLNGSEYPYKVQAGNNITFSHSNGVTTIAAATSGGAEADTLDTVCDRGSTTDKEIKVTSIDDGAAFSIYEGTGRRGQLYHYANKFYFYGDEGMVLATAALKNIELQPGTSVVLSTGKNFILGSTQWNSGDSIDGTKVANADLGDIGVSSGVWDIEEAVLGVGGSDTIFPADPNADRYLMWDDDPGVLVWSAGGGGGEATTVSDTATINLTLTGADITADLLEAGAEAILDLQDMQGAVTDAQVPDNITITEVDPTVNTEAEIEAITGAYFGASKVVTAGYIWVADGTDFESVPMSGEVGIATGGATTIADSVAVTSWALTTPTITTSVAVNADPADTGTIRLSNADYIWAEASPAGTDISVLGVDATEIIQIGASGASGVTITPTVTVAATGDSYFNEQVAIGQTSAAYLLDILGADNTTITRIKNNATQANTTATDIFISFDSTTGVEGNIAGTAVAGVVAYSTFTASHFTKTTGSPKVGEVLEITDGVIKNKQQLFTTKICSTKNSKRAIGVYGGTNIKEGYDLVLSLGTGIIWVVNKGSDLEIGDILVSSDVSGCAEKTFLPFFCNKLAKVTQTVKWQPNEKRRLVKCIYLGG